MSTGELPLPDRATMVSHVQNALSRYWPDNSYELTTVHVMAIELVSINGPLKLKAIELPHWAEEWGVKGAILVPSEASRPGAWWQQVDWWLAAFLLLECWHERVWELQHGPIHSYSFKLQGWDARVWDHAWVNRIALFLRAWVAHAQGKSPDELFGNLPQPEILMTHDVDATRKTLPIRLKQGVFNLFNAGRYIFKGETRKAFQKVGAALKLFFGHEDWWTFDRLLEIEMQAGITAHFNFYADPRKKSLTSWLFDPGYDINSARFKQLFRQIKSQQCVIGLHPTFDSWRSAHIIRQQKERLSETAEQSIITCRQHWLRYSWKDTWDMQEDAGLEMDTTLMFNDRPGFRASVAVDWAPWSQENCQTLKILALPTVMMDSHFFDYQDIDENERKKTMDRWLHEVHSVHGKIAVVWHPHTLTQDYGWITELNQLLYSIKEINECQYLH